MPYNQTDQQLIRYSYDTFLFPAAIPKSNAAGAKEDESNDESGVDTDSSFPLDPTDFKRKAPLKQPAIILGLYDIINWDKTTISEICDILNKEHTRQHNLHGHHGGRSEAAGRGGGPPGSSPAKPAPSALKDKDVPETPRKPPMPAAGKGKAAVLENYKLSHEAAVRKALHHKIMLQ